MIAVQALDRAVQRSAVRMYTVGSDTEMSPYSASCVIEHSTELLCTVTLLNGKMTKQLLRELMLELQRLGFKVLRATRKETGSLPYGEYNEEDGYWYVSIRTALKLSGTAE